MSLPAGREGGTALPVGALLAGMVSLQCGSTFAKGLFPAVGPAGAASLRVGFSALVLLAVWRPWRCPPAPGEAGWIALYGAALGAMNLLFYGALDRLPLGPAVAIEFAGPLGVALAASRRRADFGWIGLAVLGLGLLLPVSGGGLDPLGVLFAAGAGLAWAVYILCGQRAGRVDGGRAVSLGMLVAALLALPFGLVRAGADLLAPGTLAAGFAVALLSSALPYSLEMVALRRLDGRVFGVLMSLEPAVAALAAFALIGERLTPVQGLAIALVIAASAGVTAGVRGSAEPAAP